MTKQKTNRELVQAGHALANALGADSPLIEVAKLISDIATRLDVAVVRGNELQQQLDAMTAENSVMLRLLTDISENHIEYFSEGENGMFAGVPLDYVSEINMYVSRDVNAENPFPATDTILNAIWAQAIPTEFYTISNQLNAQDNRCTSHPVFCVYQKEEVVTDEGYGCDKIVWVDDYNEVADDRKFKRLEALHQGGREVDGWRRVAVKEINRFVTACFTEAGCKDYLAQNGHNLRMPFIYVTSAFRNDEFQMMRKWLMSLTTSAAKEGV